MKTQFQDWDPIPVCFLQGAQVGAKYGYNRSAELLNTIVDYFNYVILITWIQKYYTVGK